MINIITKENINKLKNEIPSLIFRSEYGAQGPSGLLIIATFNKELYVFNINYEDNYSIKAEEIVSTIPHMIHFRYKDMYEKFGLKRKYLGYGNILLFNEKYYDVFNSSGHTYGKTYALFKENFKSIFNISLEEIFSISKNQTNTY